MKLSLKRHGGWGALLKQQPITLDTNALPVDAADEICTLAAAAERSQTRGTGDAQGKGRAPEAMTYEIVLERDGKTVTMKASDVASSPEFRALQELIEKHGPKP